MKPASHQPEAGGRAAWIRWTLLAIFMGLLLFVGQLPVVAESMSRVTAWIDGLGGWAPVMFGAVYAIATVLFVPGSLLTLGAGALFGIVGGTALVSASSTVGAALSFLISRYLLRNWATRRLSGHPRFAAIDQAVGREGAKIVLLLRLSPVVPFNALNYLLGLTAVRFGTYVFWSWVGMLPGTLLYVYLGHAGRSGVQAATGTGETDWLRLGFLAVGLVATVVASLIIARIARQALMAAARE